MEMLEVRIEGGDRQILSGYVPKVAIAASKAVYRGLHLSQADVTGEQIRINLGQVLKGKHLRLLETVPVYGSLLWDEADLNASLKAPLLANALADFFLAWLQKSSLLTDDLAQALQNPWMLQESEAVIESQQVTVRLNWRTLRDAPEGSPQSSTRLQTTLRTGLSLVAENRLKLEQPQISTSLAQTKWTQLEDYEVALGQDVALQELRLELGKVWVQGQIKVLP
jgi:LmeA-like phospholipid-binding